MHDYDSTWAKVSNRFWKYRRREFLLNFLLFLAFHLIAALFLSSLPYTRFNVGFHIAGIYVGWVSLPTVTLLWSIVLLIHLGALLNIGVVERIFRLRVEREILRSCVEEDGAEKPKRHPLQPDEEVFEYAD